MTFQVIIDSRFTISTTIKIKLYQKRLILCPSMLSYSSYPLLSLSRLSARNTSAPVSPNHLSGPVGPKYCPIVHIHCSHSVAYQPQSPIGPYRPQSPTDPYRHPLPKRLSRNTTVALLHAICQV